MEICTLEEVCKRFLKIAVQTGRNRCSQGLPMPPSFRIGRRRLYVVSEVERWMSAHAGIDDAPSVVSVEPQDQRRGRPRANSSGPRVF